MICNFWNRSFDQTFLDILALLHTYWSLLEPYEALWMFMEFHEAAWSLMEFFGATIMDRFFKVWHPRGHFLGSFFGGRNTKNLVVDPGHVGPLHF